MVVSGTMSRRHAGPEPVVLFSLGTSAIDNGSSYHGEGCGARQSIRKAMATFVIDRTDADIQKTSSMPFMVQS